MAGVWTSRLRFGPQGSDLGLQARIWASRLRFGPQDWDLGLETIIWASRLGWLGRGRKRRRRKFSICVEAKVINHLGPLPCSPLNFNQNLFKQGAGTADHLTLLRLFLLELSPLHGAQRTCDQNLLSSSSLNLRCVTVARSFLQLTICTDEIKIQRKERANFREASFQQQPSPNEILCEGK